MDVPDPSVNSTESLLAALQTPSSWIATGATGIISDTITQGQVLNTSLVSHHGQSNTPSLVSHGQSNTPSLVSNTINLISLGQSNTPSVVSHGQLNTPSLISYGQLNTPSLVSHGQSNTPNVNSNRTIIPNTSRESHDKISGRPLLVSWLQKALQPETENKTISMDHSYRGADMNYESKSLENENCNNDQNVPCQFNSEYQTFQENASNDVVQLSGFLQSSKEFGLSVQSSGVESIQQQYQETISKSLPFGTNYYSGQASSENAFNTTLQTSSTESNLGVTEDKDARVVPMQNSLFQGTVTSAPLLYSYNNVLSIGSDQYKTGANQSQYSRGKQPITALTDSTHEVVSTVPALFDEHCIEQTTAGSIGHDVHMCGGCGLSFVTICQLHAHLYYHGNGGSYHYDHYTKTAFPKYDTVCCAIQTDDSGFSSGGLKTEKFGEKAQEVSFITVSPLSTSETETNVCTTMDRASNPTMDRTNNKTLLYHGEKSDTKVGSFYKVETSENDEAIKVTNFANNVTIRDGTATKIHESDVEHKTGVKDHVTTVEDGCYEDSKELESSSNDVDKSQNEDRYKFQPRKNGRFVKRPRLKLDKRIFNLKRYRMGKSVEKIDTTEENKSKLHSNQPRQKMSSTTDDPDYDNEAEKESRSKKKRKNRDVMEEHKSKKLSKQSMDKTDDPDYDPTDTGTDLIWKSKNKKQRQNRQTASATEDIMSGKYFDHVCLHCNTIFTAEKYLKNHMIRHEGKYPCDTCFVVFPDIDNYIEHICKGGNKVNKRVMIYNCNYCEEGFSELIGLKGHICENKQGTKVLIRIKTCPGKRIEEEHSVAQDFPPLIPKLEYGDVLQCNICSTICKNVSNLYSHNLTHRYSLRCSDCSLWFSDELEKNTHETICCGNDVLQCMICKKSYKNKASYAVHMRLHDGKRDFQCELCGQSFACLSYLRNHMRLQRCQQNERERTFCCDLCNKKFFDRNTLRGHIRVVHSDERKMICEICGSTFKYGSALKKHKLSHEPSRPVLLCKTCGATFTAVECLRRHEKRHVQLCGSLECSTCGKKFHERWNLKAHMRQHTGEKPYVCEVCGKAFTHNVSRKNHMQAHHGAIRQIN